MIEIYINGQTESVTAKTLSELVASKTGETDKFAVALNEEFVPKNSYQTTQLKQGDRIELLTPMSGG